MGQFSWISRDGDQIVSAPSYGQKVWMVFKSEDESNVVVREDDYEGYGEFGGIDYYELVARMNGKETRDEGIDLAFQSDIPVRYPQLFTVEPSIQDIEKINWFEECENDPNQGR